METALPRTCLHATQLAALNPRQGLVADNRTGTQQWHT